MRAARGGGGGGGGSLVAAGGSLVVAGGLGPRAGSGQTRNHSICHYHGHILEHPRIPGLFMRHGEGVQHWPDGRVYAGQWENHLYHGEGALWHDEGSYTEGLGSALYRGQWRRGKRHGQGRLRFLQPSGWSRPREKVYEGQFQFDVFAGEGHLSAEPPPEGEAPPTEKRAVRGAIPLPRIEVDELLDFEGYFRLDLDEAYEEVEKGQPGWAEQNPFARAELRLEELTQEDRQSGDGPLRRYFGDAPNRRQQVAGMPLPDLAMAYYTLRGKDTDGIDGTGRMLFTDESIYEGEFQDGLPERSGELVQRSRARSQANPEETARYSGQWLRGKRQGHGWYRTRRGVVYEGEWHDDAMAGHGVQRVPAALEAAFGFTRYEGQWFNDRQDGLGRAFLSGRPRLGTCEARRQSAYLDGPPGVLVYSGGWARSAVHAPEGQPAWAHLVDRASGVGRWYFGPLAPNGRRAGRLGFLYEADAGESEEFLAAVDRGEAFVEDHTVLRVLDGEELGVKNFPALHYTCYVGRWRHDLPEGEGVQVFRDAGTYVGQFEAGKRQGRGTWTTADGSLSYEPAGGAESNWEGDNLHGSFVVREGGRAHEGISYQGGVCQTWRHGLSEVEALKLVSPPDSDYPAPAVIHSMSAVALNSARKLDLQRSRGLSLWAAADDAVEV